MSESQPQGIPAVGTKVYFILRPYGEYVPATVVETMKVKTPAGKFEEVPLGEVTGDEAVHLEIQIDRKRYTAAASVGYRLNVTEGTEIGQYAREKPKGADAAFEKAREREQWLADENRRRMRQER